MGSDELFKRRNNERIKAIINPTLKKLKVGFVLLY